MDTNGLPGVPVLGAPPAKRGFETVALDDLGHGLIRVRPGTAPSYDDGVDDQRDQRVRDETSHDKLTARAGVPLMGLLAKTPAASPTYPMSLASKMSALADDPGAMKVLMKDRTSAANRVGVRFLDTVMLDNAGHYPLEEPGLRDQGRNS